MDKTKLETLKELLEDVMLAYPAKECLELIHEARRLAEELCDT